MMTKIENFNCDRLCNNKFCSEPYEYFVSVEVLGVEINLAFCKKHAEEFDLKVHDKLEAIKNGA